MQRQVANSSYSSFEITIVKLESEKQIKNQNLDLLNTSDFSKKFPLCQILKRHFYNASDFELKYLKRVRFSTKNFTARPVLN